MADQSVNPIVVSTPPEPPAKRPHTSFSQLSTYASCSLKYYFRYIDGQPGRPSLAMAAGKAGHTALEYNYRQKVTSKRDLALGDVLDLASDAFDTETLDIGPADLRPDEDIAKRKNEVLGSLQVHHTTIAPAQQPVLVEWEFNLDLPPTEYYEYPIKIVNGRIDLAERTAILDSKFAGRRKSQADVDQSWQLTLYDIAFERAFGVEPPGLGFQVLTPPKVRDPADTVQLLYRSPAELEPQQRARRRERLEYALRTTQRAIDAGIFMPADNPIVCATCDYRSTCQSSLAKDDWTALSIQQATVEQRP